MCMMCMILSPNCYPVTHFEYSSTDVTLLPSCLPVLSEHVASQSKCQSADLDFLKLAKKRKSVCSALFRGNLCFWSDKISNVTAILGRKSTARSKVNQNTRSPPLSESLKFRKRMGFSVSGSLRVTDSNYRESLDRFEKSKTLKLCLKNTFREFSSKILFRFSKNLTSSRNSQKNENTPFTSLNMQNISGKLTKFLVLALKQFTILEHRINLAQKFHLSSI